MSSTPDLDLDYLSPDFDPSTLTVAKLRLILVSHDVGYPSSAKKPQLIEIFNENILPQARKILGSRSRIKRTSKGITDVESSQGSTIGDDGERQSMPPLPDFAPSARRRAIWKGERASTEDDTTPPAAASSRSSRQPSAKHGRSSDTELGTEVEPKRPAVRKTRKSEVSPTVKVEEPHEPLPPRDFRADEGVFSRDNPFQSGSSPTSGDVGEFGGERRRKSGGPSTSKDASRRKSSSNRRKTEQLGPDRLPKIEDGVTVPSLQHFDMAIHRTRRSEGSDEPGEEFTPEEQLELDLSQQGSSRAILPATKRRRTSSSSVLTTAPLAILSVLLSAYAVLYRQEKLAIGYCGVPRSSSASANSPLTGVTFPEWVPTILEPQCEPCPPHARCYSDFILQCDHDFVNEPHPLSLGGLVPLPPTCEPDGEKVRKVKAVADRAVEELRDIRANYECGTLTPEGKRAAATPTVDEAALKETVSRKRRRGMSEAEFEDLWSGAIGEILQREEVVSSEVNHSSAGNNPSTHPGARRVLTSTSLGRLPLGCSLRRSVLRTLGEYRFPLSVLIAVILFAGYANHTLSVRRQTSARIPGLVRLTLERLADQAARAGSEGDKGVLAAQLRDDVLRDEWNVSRREKIWERVRAVVERNANVRASRREVGGGEIGRVWEWIGSVDPLIEGGGRRESGRISFGVPPSSEEGTPRPEMMKKGGWMENRPIY